VRFESWSSLQRIEKWTFKGSGLVEIILPASIGFLGEGCFFDCKYLSSVRFQSGSRLQGIELEALQVTGWVGRDLREGFASEINNTIT
jgi:hypothetical protein